MDALAFFDHLLNFFAPALGLALLVPSVARLVWWRALQGQWLRQVKWLLLANALVLVLGLVLRGRDGATLTYAALVVTSAVGVWWTGLR
ncbi:MAG: hypothetical protein RI907_2056 [Pseudomonadota bacterium]|jgi:hypothetical protein